jgi:hypothetical protein
MSQKMTLRFVVTQLGVLTLILQQTLEEEKMRNLSNSQTTIHDHAPGWNELLASNSEANVKVRVQAFP